MQETDQIVPTMPGAASSLLGREFLSLPRVMVFIKQHSRRAFIARVVRHKEIGGIPDKNPLAIESMMLFEDPDHLPIEPRLQPLDIRLPGHLP
jgi:hypothetical protein